MKIIELAEKVRNNEIMPQHIRYSDEDLYFDGYTYYDEEGNNDILDILAMNCSNLNKIFDEVEIIEKDKKIEKITNMNCIDAIDSNCYEEYSNKAIALDINTLRHQINKIIDYLEEKE